MNKLPHVITIDDTECFVSRGTYNNDTVALTLIDAGTHEHFMVPTINAVDLWRGTEPYALAFQWPVVVIKDYAENEGIFDKLVKEGVISKGGAYMEGTEGGVKIGMLSTKWQKILDVQSELYGNSIPSLIHGITRNNCRIDIKVHSKDKGIFTISSHVPTPVIADGDLSKDQISFLPKELFHEEFNIVSRIIESWKTYLTFRERIRTGEEIQKSMDDYYFGIPF